MLPESENQNEITEKATLEEVAQDLGSPEEGDSKSNDGAFWIVQRIFWGLLKSLIPLCGMAFVIWIIWGVRPLGFLGGNEERAPPPVEVVQESQESVVTEKGFFSKLWEKAFSKKETPKEASPEFKLVYEGEGTVPSIEEQLRGNQSFLSPENVYILAPGKSKPSLGTDYKFPDFKPRSSPKIPELDKSSVNIRPIIVFAEGLSEVVQTAQRGTNVIGNSVDWLREAKQFATVEISQVILIADPQERAQKISEKLQKGESLFESAFGIKRELEAQNRFWNSELSLYEAESNKAREDFFKAVENFESLKAETFADKFQILDLKVLEARNKMQVYGSLFKNVENFERLLRQKTIPLYAPLQ